MATWSTSAVHRLYKSGWQYWLHECWSKKYIWSWGNRW